MRRLNVVWLKLLSNARNGNLSDPHSLKFTMTLPPVHSLETTEYYVSGAVTIHPSVAIAPGVVIEAGSGQEITIGEGVCIGLGSVITAHHGSITIAAEVTLAPGTLIVGPANLGEAACVGTRSSICGQDIDTHSLIPPGSLLMPAPTGKRQQLSFSAASTSTDSASPAENQEIPSPWDESSNGSSVTQDVPAPPRGHNASPQEPLPQMTLSQLKLWTVSRLNQKLTKSPLSWVRYISINFY